MLFSGFPDLKIKNNQGLLNITKEDKTLNIDIKMQYYSFSSKDETKKGAYNSITALINQLIYNKKS